LKVFHIIQSMGPTWIAHVERPKIDESASMYETWVEEIEFVELSRQFESYISELREFDHSEEFQACLIIRS
jgi:hypothetical protein